MGLKFLSNRDVVSLMSSGNIVFGDNAYVKLDATWKNSDVVSPYTRLYFVESGTAYLFYDGQTVTMTAGNVYVVPAGLKFGYSCDGSLTKLYFHVNIFRRDGFDIMLGVKNICVFKLGKDETSALISRYLDRNSVNAVLIKSRIYNVLSMCISECGISGEGEKSYSALVLGIIDSIHSRLSAKLSAKNIADAMFISESKLSKVFRAETGYTVGKYIDELVMFESQRRLLDTELSISDVSDSLGFCDQFYFSRRFKRQYGQTPSVYRAKLERKDFTYKA